MPAFLDGGGECGALIKSRDWSSSLGPVERWPQSLKAATGLLLRSPVPMVMLWGDEGIMLYNDGYSVFAGGRHPELLGSRVREGWPEVADFNDHVMKVGLAGGTLSFRDQELVLYRHGRPENVSMNLDYSPVLGDDGKPAGVLAIVIDTTTRVAAERALQARAERLDLFDRLSQAIGDLAAPDEIMAVTARLLGQHMKASVVAYADMEIDENAFTIRGDWAAEGAQSIVGSYSLDTFGETAAKAMHGGTPLIIRDVRGQLGEDEGAKFLSIGIQATICMPYVRAGKLAAMMAVHQNVPRVWSEDELALVAEATERSWAHIVRVRSEAILRESEDRFRNIADHTPVMLWVTDETGYCTYLNRTWYDFTGQKEHEGEGFGWLNAVHEDDRPEAERAFLTANDRQQGYEVDFRIRRPDGSYRWCIDAAAPRFDGSGNFMGYVGSVIDVDERRESVERVRRSEEQLRAIIDQMPVGVAIARVPSGEIFLYNQALEEMLGHPALSEGAETYDRYGGIDHQGRPLPAERYALYRATKEGETVTNEEIRYRRPDGRVITLLAQATPILDDDGKAGIAIVALQDITGRKKAEAHQQLLINELSHRAKNLLAIIQSIAQQTFRGDDPAAAQLTRFEGRLGALSAAHGILTQEKWEAVPLRRLICDTFTAVFSDDERLTLDGPDLMLSPKASVSLAMAIHELATNATKYGSLSQDGGEVAIRWEDDGDRLKLSWKESGGPPVAQPTKRGFGTRMIERGLAAELGGSVRIHYEPDGVRCDVDAPMPAHG
ncbi:PAS domain S-box-containing protein [Sphingomonas kaistensis]|uniref:histidine kinase n=1 Tax=Sphingomonas kaistensis TaxID=298708 RepID=A0A7X5Y5K0_9SPHN|nr:PAS domain S-box protein [Sphingomonas kaistensis]NJC05163.1 PAS domain S-box-containing protein [Sphingomonas kaistensis]